MNDTKCKHLNMSEECRANNNELCENINDCYFKQLQQLKQENEELKEELHKSREYNLAIIKQGHETMQKLEKVKEECKYNFCYFVDGTCGSLGQDILQIIESEE